MEDALILLSISFVKLIYGTSKVYKVGQRRFMRSLQGMDTKIKIPFN